jgi:hypothetical protein
LIAEESSLDVGDTSIFDIDGEGIGYAFGKVH